MRNTSYSISDMVLEIGLAVAVFKHRFGADLQSIFTSEQYVGLIIILERQTDC